MTFPLTVDPSFSVIVSVPLVNDAIVPAVSSVGPAGWVADGELVPLTGAELVTAPKRTMCA